MAEGAVRTADATREPASLRSTTVWAAALIGWSLFVWGGRIRNALTDERLGAADLAGSLLLALSFVVPTLVLLAMLVRRRARPSDAGRSRAFTVVLRSLAAWTTGVWVLRAGDIVLGGDHEVGFVVVHVVLAVVSIALAAGAVVTDERSGRARRDGRTGVA